MVSFVSYFYQFALPPVAWVLTFAPHSHHRWSGLFHFGHAGVLGNFCIFLIDNEYFFHILTSLKRVPEKYLLLLYWLHQNLWLCGSQQTGKSLKRWEYQTTLPVSWETCMQIKKQQLELDMEQWTGSKLGKEYVKAVYCHPAYLTYMQSTSFRMLGWMKHKLESGLQGEISITSDMQITPPLWQKAERN